MLLLSTFCRTEVFVEFRVDLESDVKQTMFEKSRSTLEVRQEKFAEVVTLTSARQHLHDSKNKCTHSYSYTENHNIASGATFPS